jgi:hypothetical protein
VSLRFIYADFANSTDFFGHDDHRYGIIVLMLSGGREYKFSVVAFALPSEETETPYFRVPASVLGYD